jgi:hypothetical protein
MFTVLFSETFFEKKINSIIRRFWWAGIWEEHVSNPIAYCSLRDICKPKDQGGSCIRDMELINKSLIIQSTWHVVTDKNPFISSILKAMYYPNTSIWTAPTVGPRSVYWSSILQVKHHLHTNYIL